MSNARSAVLAGYNDVSFALAERLRSPAFSRWGWVRRAAARAYADRILRAFDVRGGGPTVPARALSGRVRVDMTRGATGGVTGVPLVVGGTLDEPQVALSRSALLGAAIGTAVLPGAGAVHACCPGGPPPHPLSFRPFRYRCSARTSVSFISLSDSNGITCTGVPSGRLPLRNIVSRDSASG